jgi:type III restriction enzyme
MTSHLPPDRIRAQIKARLSLRPPQAQSLDILADVLSFVALDKGSDPAAVLAAIRESYPNVTDFERDFPSLCFSLATGVGKTRLMGAFISYLYLTGRSTHFFVLAPNTTIYEKLIRDFTPKTPKYVFAGIAEFAINQPVIVTGDTWDRSSLLIEAAERNDGAIVNIFNVDKINSDKGRIRKMHEYVGAPYFDYLAGLPDLVLLMDEAHRYRAKAGMRAVAELKPILGLELTATPRSTGARSTPFKNVILDYSLGQAMADGFVKEPAVATRADFDPKTKTTEELEDIKLQDGVLCHENVKTELDIYARSTGKQKVHPFMLVVAQTTEHAETIRQKIASPDFFAGRYAERVIRVDSRTDGELTDEATARLVSLEHDAKTDIVIHVNKLGEGWDVNNLYTIVPLRASASDILTEQTLGRGLRLPYGARTGVDAVDTLTVIAHDRFAEVVAAARDDQSILRIRKTVIIGAGGDISDAGATVLVSKSHVEETLTGFSEGGQTPYTFNTPAEREAAGFTLRVIEGMESELTRGISQLSQADVQRVIVSRVTAAMTPAQGEIVLGDATKLDIARVVAMVAKKVEELTIEIPHIVVLPDRAPTYSFRDFDLSGLGAMAYQPTDDRILLQELRTEQRRFLSISQGGPREERPENYIVRHLIDFNEISYDDHAELLFKLAGQAVAHLRSYLADEDALENVLLTRGIDLARFIFTQMMQPVHVITATPNYIGKVTRGFTMLRPQAFNVPEGAPVQDIRRPTPKASDTRRLVFGGFNKCCYPFQRFDSEPERAFAAIIDSPAEKDVLRWMKPAPRQFQIEYASGQAYEPDFVVETATQKLIVEIKRRDEMDDPIVQAKSAAARRYVADAGNHGKENGGKTWAYLLVPHDAVASNTTFSGLRGTFAGGLPLRLPMLAAAIEKTNER